MLRKHSFPGNKLAKNNSNLRAVIEKIPDYRIKPERVSPTKRSGLGFSPEVGSRKKTNLIIICEIRRRWVSVLLFSGGN